MKPDFTHRGMALHGWVTMAAAAMLTGCIAWSCPGADWTGEPVDWSRVSFPPSENWTPTFSRLDCVDLAVNGRGETELYMAHKTWNSVLGAQLKLFSLNLDDEHRRWQTTVLPGGPALSGSSGPDELLYVISPTNFYYIDRENVLWHCDGTGWAHQLDLERQGAIYGFAPDEIVAVGYGGSFIFNGTTWETVATLPGPTGGDYALWRNGPRDYFVGSSMGLLYRWQNGALSVIPTGDTGQVTGVWGFSATDVYISQVFGSADTRIRHYDGTSVTTVWQEALPADGHIWHLTGLDDGTLMGVGYAYSPDTGFIVTRSPAGVWSCGSVDHPIQAVDSLGMHSAAVGADAMVLNRGELRAEAGPLTFGADLISSGYPSIDIPFSTALRPETVTYQLQVSFDGGVIWYDSSFRNIYEQDGIQVASVFTHFDRTCVLYRVLETRAP